jgi:anti-anti-sigma factor
MGVEEPFRIITTHAPDRVIVQVEGELDLLNAPELESVLAEPAVEQAAALVLDLRGLSFTDSSGLRAIFAARNAAQTRGQPFAVTPGSEQVQRLLAITHLAEHLNTIASPADALS